LVYDVFFGGYGIERFLTKAAFPCGFFVDLTPGPSPRERGEKSKSLRN
jgi:hypothetical protein